MSEQYFDSEGEPTTLYRMVRTEPDWAMSRIRVGEAAIKELGQLKSVAGKVSSASIQPHDVHALERAAIDLESQAERLIQDADYGADIYASDAESIRRVLAAVKSGTTSDEIVVVDPVNDWLIEQIDRDICELTPYNPNKEDAICIKHEDLLFALRKILSIEQTDKPLYVRSR